MLSGAPVVSSVTIAGNGITNGTGDLNAGKSLGVYLNFDSTVTFTPSNSGQYPTLTLNDGATATFNSADTGTSFGFVYNVAAGDNTADLTVVGINLNGATIQGNGFDADVTGAVTNPAGILQVDTTNPTASISLVGPSGQAAGTALQFAVTFSEPVSGVDASQFSLSTSGVIGASITNVTQGIDAAHYLVDVASGSGAGTVALNFMVTKTSDLAGNPFGSAVFSSQQTYSTALNPISVAVDDVNGDGRLDLIVADLQSANLQELLGNGDGTFSPPSDITTAQGAFRVTLGDINGDGKLDIVTATVGGAYVSVLMGNGDGTFATEKVYATALTPTSVVLGDVNGDGKPDIVVANEFSNTVGILINNGNGAFAAEQSIAAGRYPYAVTLGDVNGDGKSDIVVTNLWDTSVSILLGNGDGTFATRNAFRTGTEPNAVVLGDLNDDGKLDIVVSNYNANTVSVLLGKGDGTFTGIGEFAAGDYPGSAVLGDINGDGRPDIVVGDQTSNKVSVLFGIGDGTFGIPHSVPAGQRPISVALGDFNNDGKLDVVATNYNDQTISVMLNAFAPVTSPEFTLGINHSPLGTANTVLTLEDTAYPFTTADFGFSDLNDSPANSLLAVKITTLPDSGLLADDGIAVTAGQFVSAVDISSGKLKFTPAANSNGTANASFTFQVQDDGGTAAGGIDLDPSPKQMTIDVSSVNDAPSQTSGTVTMLEDQPYVVKISDFGFADQNDNPANQLLAVKFDIVTAYGTLTDNGVAVTANQYVPAADISQGKLVFSPAANLNGGPYFLAKFQVQDDGGTANGGVDLDPMGQVLTFKPTSVNDAPAGTSGTVTVVEDQGYVLKTSDFGFTDPNDKPANQLLAVKFDIVSAYGSLTDNGVAVTANQFVSALDISHGKLVFTPSANLSGGPYFLAKFQVQDNGGTANGGVDLDPVGKVMTFQATNVNDAPVGTSGTVTLPENRGYALKTSDFGLTDPNDKPANQLLAVKFDIVSSYGTLTDNGVAVTANQSVSALDISHGKLVFTPSANLVGGPYFLAKFQVQDNGETANGGVDLDPVGKVLTFKSTSVNHAPTGTSGTVTTREDQPYVLKTSDFGFSDPNDSTANQLLAVKFVLLSAYGTLTDNGVAVTTNQFVSASDISNAKLIFTPSANVNGGPYFLAKFQVQDNGGTANGGIDLDPVAKVLTYTAASVNDAPVGSSKTVSTFDSIPYTFAIADFGFTDPNDHASNKFRAVSITTLPFAGILTDNGIAVSAGQFIPVADISAGKLKFTPVANATGVPYAMFTFQVQDDGGTANGGVDLDPTAKTMTINVYLNVSLS